MVFWQGVSRQRSIFHQPTKFMFWNFRIFLLSVLFFAALRATLIYSDYIFWIWLLFGLVLLFSTRRLAKRWFFAILPLLLSASSVSLLFFIDSLNFIKVFVFLTAAVFYFCLLGSYRLSKYNKDQTAKGMYNTAAFSALFFFYAASYGWYLNEIRLPVWELTVILMAIFAVITFFISSLSFTVNQLSSHERWLYAFILALALTQVVWIQSFWPFGYLTVGTVALIIYYVSWDIIRNYFSDKFSFKEVVFNLAFLFGSIAILLVSSKWYPVV